MKARLWAAAALIWVGCAACTVDAVENIADDQITLAVETELIVDDGVASHLIDVETNDGIVTLSGSVDSLLGKKRAVEIAEHVKGVRAVVDTIEVKPVVRTDEEIIADVKAALGADPATDAYEINVTATDGVVTLTGTVESHQEKTLCADVASGVRGVMSLDNAITVLYRTERPDSEIKPEIEGALANDVRIDAELIDVSVANGAVTLTGKVGSAAERSLAKRLSYVAGVKSVDASGLETAWWARDDMERPKNPKPSDAAIKKAVTDAFLHDPRVLSYNPEVKVEDGVVTLTGEVEDLSAKLAAEDTAKNVVGVKIVYNFLRVRPEEPPSDEELAARIRAALLRDPVVDRHEIMVSAVNAKAFLYGNVDSTYEKSWAKTVASRVEGIVDVHNGLTANSDWTWKPDWQIRQDIEAQLQWSPFIEADDDVDVFVENGVATLKGEVDSWFEWRKAEENAWQGGAKDVHNFLKVETIGS